MERRTSFLTETRKIPLTLDSMDAYMSLFEQVDGFPVAGRVEQGEDA